MRTNVERQKNMTKSLILLTNIFKNMALFACFVDFCVLPYMYKQTKRKKMIVKINKQALYCINLNLPVNNEVDANKAKDAFQVLTDLRQAGARNLMYCLSWRKSVTSKRDKKAVAIVGASRVKRAFDFFAREFGKAA